MIKIGVLGEGWLGDYLLQKLKTNGYNVKGAKAFQCYFRNNRWEGDLPAFLENLSHLIITIPSGINRSTIKADASEGNLTLFKQLMSHINKHPDLTVFYTSSISVYGRSETIIDEDTRLDPKTSSARAITKIEKQFEDSQVKRFNALRLGGLIGKDRHPIYSLLRTQKNVAKNELINFIHREDILRCIEWLMRNPQDGPLNLVSPKHPTKIEYYSRIAKERNLNLPVFTEGGIVSRVVSKKLPLEQICIRGI